jgi:recombination protein RecT
VTRTQLDQQLAALDAQMGGRAEVEKHRDQFASTKNKQGEIYGTWVEHFDAMARKTVIRQLLNYLPVSVELREANVVDVQEATPQFAGNVSYGAPIAGALPPENVDPHTGEIDAAGDAVDPMDAIDTEAVEE